ncbi:ABC transporter permease [Halobacillus naozhouensis]|uniref:Molybdenum transport system permease n=1 Tax=Halobacillus naozhouensis TaxID=554880 RepID=A0ABY8IWA5_9BACI|nr:ABC transporter permease [Halobacillus naozhouensis]WFT74504.1 ABC transporter permease [Halobacillus naozhouensis]
MSSVCKIGQLLLLLLVIATVTYLVLPLISVFITKSPLLLWEKLNGSLAYQALTLSLKTTVISMAFIIVFCTPLAYRLAKSEFPGKKGLEVVLKMPIVAPTAVVGVGLLLVFGQRGLLSGAFSLFNVEIPFTAIAVVMAQIFMASPFYLNTARQSFEAIDDQLLDVSRTLGVSPQITFWRVTIPLAFPGLLTGVALSWALALGEFGATMMFAGNMPGTTQTLPLAIYTAMESDATVAVAISALLLTVSFFLLLFVSLIEKYMRNKLAAS